MKHYFLFSIGLFALNSAFSQNFSLLKSSSEAVEFSFDFNEISPEIINLQGEDYLDYSKTYKVLTQESGAPALPVFHKTIQLPAQGIVSVELVDYDVVEYQNQSVLPSKGSLKRNVNPATVPYTFGITYQENEFYPSLSFGVENPFVWRSLRGAVVDVNPVQYNPVTKTLRVYQHMKFRVSFNQNVAGINELAQGVKDPVLSQFQQQMVMNSTQEKYTPKAETGTMLVIAPDAYLDDIQPLVDWKNQKGIYTKLISTDSTGTTDTDILAYVQNYYSSHPDLLFLLLVGDNTQVPAHNYGTSTDGDQSDSDTYYGQLTGSDYYPELFVGRFSGTETNVATMVSRTLEYEKNPAAGSWMQNAIGIGSGEGSGYGDDGEADWQHIRNIRTDLLNFGYNTVYEFYDGTRSGEDSSGDPTATMVQTAVSTGVGLLNYCGHGDVNLMYTSNFTGTNINAATNNGMYPFVVSVACYNGKFVDETCISEYWLRAKKNGTPTGAIAAAGSSILMAWAEPMQTQDEMGKIIAETYPANHKTLLGGLFYNSQMSMLESYPSATGREVIQTWVLFGDPSAQFRNKITMDLNISAPANVPQTTTSINVNCDVDGALVAISQNNVLLGYAYASGGLATITISTLATDDYLIATATKQNYATKQTVIQVGNGPLAVNEQSLEFAVYPNPVKDQISVSSTADLENAQLSIYNTAGALVKTVQLNNGQNTINVGNLASGMYVMEVKSASQTGKLKFIKE